MTLRSAPRRQARLLQVSPTVIVTQVVAALAVAPARDAARAGNGPGRRRRAGRGPTGPVQQKDKEPSPSPTPEGQGQQDAAAGGVEPMQLIESGGEKGRPAFAPEVRSGRPRP